MKGPASHHKPHPLSLAVRNTMAGATLVELLLVAGVIVSGTAIVLAVAHNTQVQGKRSQAQKDVQALQSRLLAGYRNQSNFNDITTDSARADGLFPSSMLDPIDGQPRTPWGGAITIAGVSSPGSSLNDSLVVALEDVPGRDCVETASSLASGFSEIRVNGISVGAGQALDVGRLAEACSGRSGNRLELVWNNPNASATSGWCVGDGTYETRSLTCPPGQLGTIHESRLLSCPDLYADAVAGPWTEVANTCAPECVVPNPAVQTQERAGPSCPAGQLGEIVESRTLTYSCPAPTGSPNIDYSAWTVSSNTCAPICEAPMPETDSRRLSCPTGQLGEIIEEQVTTYICPAPTGSPTSSKSPWTVVSNTCAPECVAPPALVETENGTGSCPATQVTPSGSKTYARSRTATTTYTCPAPTGDYKAEPTTYTPWSPSASQACAPACVLPNPNNQTDRETRTGTQTLSCPSGQLGEIRQSQPQERTRTRTASCPAPTGNPTWGSWTSWSSWKGAGSWTTVSSTCAPACVLPNPSTQTRAGTPQTRNLAQTQTVTVYEAGTPASQTVYNCPAGRYGHSIQQRPTRRSRTATQNRTQPQTRTTTQTRTATCPAPTGNPTWGSWSSPGAPYGTWTNNGSASSWSSPGAPYGSWSGYSQHGSWSTTSTNCTNCPAPNSNHATGHRWNGTYTQNCSAGQYGIITRERQQERKQTRSYNCPAGTRTLPSPTDTWGSYYNNGVTRLVSNTCKTCPSLSPQSQSTTQTGSQWVNSGDCQQREQTRTRTGTRTRSRSYNCPSGTTSLPPISYGSWSNYSYGSWGSWSNTNNYRNRSNSGSQSEPYTQCPMGQTLVNPGSRTRTWTCSNGSKSYGNWQVTSFPQCCRPGLGCQIQ